MDLVHMLCLCGIGSNALGGLPAGKTKMSLDPDEDEEAPLLAGSLSASQALSKMNRADGDKSGGGLAGPIVTGQLQNLQCTYSVTTEVV